jgi:hypothetical protein
VAVSYSSCLFFIGVHDCYRNFGLTQKVTKKSRQKKASTRRQNTQARFSVRPLPAFVFGFLMLISF